MQVVGISYDSVDTLQQFAAKRKITYSLLADPGSQVIKAYGLLNREADDRIAGVPYPGTMIVDQAGIVRAKLFFDGHRDRHAGTDILDAVRKLEKPE